MTTEPFIVNADDLKRWKGIKLAFLKELTRDRFDIWGYAAVSRTTLENAAGGSINPATRISELRKDGWLVKCFRGTPETDTWYQLTGYTGSDNTRKRHCATCRCESGDSQ